MKLSRLILLVCAALLLTSSLPLTAGDLVLQGGEPVGLLNPDEGWAQSAPGVWQRDNLDGFTETFATGRAGLGWVLEDAQARTTELFDLYFAEPSDGLWDELQVRLAVIGDLEAQLAGDGLSKLTTRASCTQTITTGASAGGAPNCKNKATGLAKYTVNRTDTCPNCTIYASAYVSRTCGSVTTSSSQTCSKTGVGISCSVSAELGGAANSCYAAGYASVSCPGNFWSQQKTSQTCNGSGQICLACAVIALP